MEDIHLCLDCYALLEVDAWNPTCYKKHKADGHVVIGDRTELGAGAKILPNVTIGSHCHIGANAVVVEDIPDGATCVLTKPRVIIKKKDNDE